MATPHQTKLPFVLFQLKGVLYAVACKNVREIIVLPKVTGVPCAPPDVRGVINLRGKIIQLMDLRVRLGMPPLRTETETLIQLLHDREKDHRNWLAELEACVREGRPFAMARDPHRCKFGLWYDQFKTEDRLLRMTLPSMDEPHKKIHATADQALDLAEKGQRDKALELINARRNHELASLIKLFEESRRTLVDGNREAAVVLVRRNDFLAFSADLVEAVEHIPEESIAPMPPALAGLNPGLQCRVGKRAKTNETILMLNDDFFSSVAVTN